MLKKLFKSVFLLALIALPLFAFSWWKTATGPVDSRSKEDQVFVVPQGWGSTDIVRKLKDAGLIRSGLAFQIMLVKQGYSNKLQAGDFRLSPSMGLAEITEALTHGTLDVWVTIPEGLRKEEIVRIIVSSFADQGVELEAEDLLAQTADLEGYLFPDTYLIPKEAEIETIIRILEGTFEQKFNTLTLNTSLTEKQTVILASLVEREAKADKDRPIIAGILLKRLRKGWPLQVDAAVQYAKADLRCESEDLGCKWWPLATPSDIDNIESLYNTYKHLGLPPTPICNPGLASLQAAANPQSSDYWFYLSDDNGQIHYSETAEEHEENIVNYLN